MQVTLVPVVALGVLHRLLQEGGLSRTKPWEMVSPGPPPMATDRGLNDVLRGPACNLPHRHIEADLSILPCVLGLPCCWASKQVFEELHADSSLISIHYVFRTAVYVHDVRHVC